VVVVVVLVVVTNCAEEHSDGVKPHPAG